MRTVLTHIENSQLPAIERAADLVVHALQNNGVIYCWEIGHGIQGDFIHRAGGLAVDSLREDSPHASVLGKRGKGYLAPLLW